MGRRVRSRETESIHRSDQLHYDRASDGGYEDEDVAGRQCVQQVSPLPDLEMFVARGDVDAPAHDRLAIFSFLDSDSGETVKTLCE